ncbi:hypothetical protein AAE115_004708 [Salmonella enterica]
MRRVNPVLKLLTLFLLFGVQASSVYANTASVSDSGKTATLILPMKATISADTIMRDTVTIIPLSSVYEQVKWDKSSGKFIDHHFLVRVVKDEPSPLLYEIINDAYTCSFNNQNNLNPLFPDISVVNADYNYSVTAEVLGTRAMDSGRSIMIDVPAAWLPVQNTSQHFIDLTLNITFPDIRKYTALMRRGGFCRGSVTMLVSKKL